jgi:light-regulated signal transduction histidine kinase (bacteriophytochrome)
MQFSEKPMGAKKSEICHKPFGKGSCNRFMKNIGYYLNGLQTSIFARAPAETTSLRHAMEPIIATMRQNYSEHGLSICVGSFPDVTLNCNQAHISSMVVKLIENACSLAKSRVIISWDKDPKWVQILFDNDGAGAEPGNYEHAYQNCKRHDRGKMEASVSLRDARSLAAQYRGRVNISKSPLGGLRAELALPKSASASGLKARIFQ